MDQVGRVVREWLSASATTAGAAARLAGVSASTLHRVVNDQVDPSMGTLQEIAIACGVQVELSVRSLSDPMAAMAARSMVEDGYNPPAGREIVAWRERLVRRAGSNLPIEIVRAAAAASSPLERPGSALYRGAVPVARIASAGDASRGRWAVSGAAGLLLPAPDDPIPAVTILWCADQRTTMQLLADTPLEPVRHKDQATLAVITAEPELFTGSFSRGIVRFAAPIQIILDCIAQGGPVADEALNEGMSW